MGRALEDATLLDEAERKREIVNAVLQLARAQLVTHAFVEDYAYALSAQSGIKLAELGGAVKDELYHRLGLVVVPVNQSTVRKFFLGKLPKKDRAMVTHQALRGLGSPWEESDRGDAFLVANYGRTELGLPGLTLAV